MPKTNKQIQEELDRELDELLHEFETMPLMPRQLSLLEESLIRYDMQRELCRVMEAWKSKRLP